MNRRRHLGLWLALAGLLIVATPGFAQSAKAKAKAKMKASAGKKANTAELASGVIVKVAPAAGAAVAKSKGSKSVLVTINTAAVWRDWVRDQATTDPKSPKEAAREGEKSVATTGEPVSPDTTVVIELGADTKVETRYRSATDEVSEGAKTPGGAAAAEAATDAGDRTTNDKKAGAPPAMTPEPFTLNEIKPGLFIEVEYHRVGTKERAKIVRVLRPIGGANIPAGAEPKK